MLLCSIHRQEYVDRPLGLLELVVIDAHGIDHQPLHERADRAVALVVPDQASLEVAFVGDLSQVGHDHVDRQDALGGCHPSPDTGYMA